MESTEHVSSLASSFLLEEAQVQRQNIKSYRYDILIIFFCLPQADIFFVTASRTLYGHKAILLPLLPYLASISCSSCQV